MGTSLINTLGRKCQNCKSWNKMKVGEHTGYCDRIGLDANLRMCYPDKEHITFKAKTTDYSLCDHHTFTDEHTYNTHPTEAYNTQQEVNGNI